MAWNGYPPDPTKAGWHWLLFGKLTPAFWDVETGQWMQGGLMCGGAGGPDFIAGKHFIGGVQYVGPCVMPTNVAVLNAHKENWT